VLVPHSRCGERAASAITAPWHFLYF
jgi:hypothetical protein